jgi:PIN domain nuclease of toxin-antitoxin system
MELILDTCGFLSLAGLAERSLTDSTLQQIEEASAVYVSACSLFEILIKNKKGGLPVRPFKNPMALWRTAVKEFTLTVLPVSDEIFFQSTQLADIHNDPFDRIILCEALQRNIILVTYDAMLRRYGVSVTE